MSSRELGPEWVLSASLANAEAWSQDDVSELAIVARRLWPRVQAHARKELTNKRPMTRWPWPRMCGSRYCGPSRKPCVGQMEKADRY